MYDPLPFHVQDGDAMTHMNCVGDRVWLETYRVLHGECSKPLKHLRVTNLIYFTGTHFGHTLNDTEFLHCFKAQEYQARRRSKMHSLFYRRSLPFNVRRKCSQNSLRFVALANSNNVSFIWFRGDDKIFEWHHKHPGPAAFTFAKLVSH